MTRLQQLLIQRISSVKDERLLLEINRILETGIEEEVYKLNEEQISILEEAEEQIKKGLYLTNKEANKKTEECLQNFYL